MPAGPMTRRCLLAAVASSPALAVPCSAAALPHVRIDHPIVPGPFVPTRPRLFRSFILGGFECSSHRRADGRRLDLIAGTRHDVMVLNDYQQLAEHGIHATRDGVRWNLVETVPGQYDWSSVLPMLRAAEATDMQVAWDLFHYGWPDGLDIFSAAFVDRFARYAAAFGRLHLQETGRPPIVCPINEMSFFAWAGGDMAQMNPGTRGRGRELKMQLVRAAIAGIHALRQAAPNTRTLAIEPVIHVVPHREEQTALADAYYNLAQFQAWDMLSGRLAPELGGGPDMLDVLGINYYWNNQWACEGHWLSPDRWLCEGEPLSPFDPRHRPLQELLALVHTRYDRPVFVAETSIEGDKRAAWLDHVGGQVGAALRAGVPVQGICLYPVLSHPGWDDDRYCPNGLLEMGDQHNTGRRPVNAALAAGLHRQQLLVKALFGGGAEAATDGLPRGSAPP